MKNGQLPSSRACPLSHQTAVLHDTVLLFSRQHTRNYFSNSEAILLSVNMFNSAFKDLSYLDGWMASPTRWTWVWASSGSWWQTGKPGMLQSMGSQRVDHDWVTELNYQSTGVFSYFFIFHTPIPLFPVSPYRWDRNRNFVLIRRSFETINKHYHNPCLGFPGGSAVKKLPAHAENAGLLPGSGRSPGEGNGRPLQYPFLENPWSLEHYSPWGHKQSDTQRLNSEPVSRAPF